MYPSFPKFERGKWVMVCLLQWHDYHEIIKCTFSCVSSEGFDDTSDPSRIDLTVLVYVHRLAAPRDLGFTLTVYWFAWETSAEV